MAKLVSVLMITTALCLSGLPPATVLADGGQWPVLGGGWYGPGCQSTIFQTPRTRHFD